MGRHSKDRLFTGRARRRRTISHANSLLRRTALRERVERFDGERERALHACKTIRAFFHLKTNPCFSQLARWRRLRRGRCPVVRRVVVIRHLPVETVETRCAVDSQSSAADVGSCWGEQKANSAGNFLNRAKALRWDIINELLKHLRVGVIGCRCLAVNDARGYGINPDAVRSPFNGESFGQVVNRSTRSACVDLWMDCLCV
jgi:hypothetical protein